MIKSYLNEGATTGRSIVRPRRQRGNNVNQDVKNLGFTGSLKDEVKKSSRRSL